MGLRFVQLPPRKGATMKPTNIFSIVLITMLLSACASFSPASPTATPVDVNAVQTSVFQTVVANVTQTALAQPTQAPSETPVPAATETLTPAVTATVTPTATAVAGTRCDDALFVSDASVADGTHMGPGQAFVKTWRVKNIGTCTWKTTYHVSYGFGEKFGGLPTALSAEVLPGQETEISVNLTTPQKAGNYFANWKLTNASGIFFGQGLTVAIVVP